MIDLKNLCLLLIFSFIFANCSAAQEKRSPESPTKTTESFDRVNPETKRYESPAGNFSINIPQVSTQVRTLEAEKGQEPGKQFFWQFEKTVYTVMYSTFNENDSGTRNTIEKLVGKSFSEKEISLGKYKGKEFIYINSNGVKYVMRNYLVNNMGYLLTAGFVDEISEKEALAVLDSFKLLNE
jgi:hypothetical protein